MSRLASFKGPSSPSQSPVRAQPTSTPSSPSRLSETTHHRKVRTLLFELRTAARIWDDITFVDGLKAAQSLVDSRTELDNELALQHPAGLPCTRTVGQKIKLMEKRIFELSLVLLKLKKQFEKMVAVVDGLESVIYDATKTKGWRWVHDEPLWVTWSLERFVTEIPAVLPVYHRALYRMTKLVASLRTHDATFETSRSVISQWASQPWLEDGGWWSDWEDLCSIEVERWDTTR